MMRLSARLLLLCVLIPIPLQSIDCMNGCGDVGWVDTPDEQFGWGMPDIMEMQVWAIRHPEGMP
jgi:hypothetical protein